MFVVHKVNDSETGHKDPKIVFNKNIWRDDSIGEINIFLGGKSPGIELWKLLICEDGES